MGAAVLGSAMGEVWGGEEGTQLRSRISSFIRRARLRRRGGRKAGEWALRSAAECTCHPSVGLWDKERLSCGCAPLRWHLDLRDV